MSLKAGIGQKTPPRSLALSLSRGLRVFSRRLSEGLFVLAVLATGLLLLPTTADVLLRLAGSRSLPGAVEIVESCMALLVFSSLAFINEKRAHLRVEFLYGKFPHGLRQALDLGASAAALLLFCLMARSLTLLALSKIEGGETTLMLGLGVGWMQLFGAACLGALGLSLLTQTTEALAGILSRGAWAALAAGLLFALGLCLTPLALKPFFADAQSFLPLGGGGMLFLLALLLLGLPIGMAMAGLGYMGMIVAYNDFGAASLMLGQLPWASAANYLYAVIPMFILMGELALCAGISADLFRAASLWLGHLPGGLAIATVAGCAGFAAVSGDSLATAVTMAAVALPEMERHRYDSGLACATLAAGGTLGILIPPSTGFIFYSLITEESLGALFLAGVLPGVLLALLFALLLALFALRRPDLAPRGEAAPLKQRLAGLKGVLPMLGLAALIVGGILLGWFSPNEGGAVGATGTALYALARGRLSGSQLRRALASTALITSRLLLILMGVGLLSAFLAASALPMELAEILTGIHAPRMAVFACIVLFYMALGCIMNVVPMMLLTLPALFPAVLALGFDPLWFGVVVVIMMEMGQITPPVGLNVYAMAAAARHVPMPDIFKRIPPFFLAMLLLVALLALFPSLATWLPGTLLG